VVGLVEFVELLVGACPPVVFGSGAKPRPNDNDNEGALTACLNTEISESKALNRSNDNRNNSSDVG
jgi:hypothetical protein